ncbi:pyrroline-5-carboxylate reductase [Breznakiellaceae bacterium SP9]
MISISCIGSGNMGAALMRGAAKVLRGEYISVTDTDRAKAQALARDIGAHVCADSSDAVQRGDFIFLAVKPQLLPPLLTELAAPLRSKAAAGFPAPVLVSMAAGWSIEKIRGGLGCPTQPVIRIMPNTPALIGKGMLALCATADLAPVQLTQIEELLSAVAVVDRVDEKYMDAVTGLSGSGPAFVYLFIEALADGGVRSGLPRDKALRYAAQTVFGSAAMVLESGKHPGELKDMVCSPAGTTIEGVAALEQNGFRGAVMEAVNAAYLRSIELGSCSPSVNTLSY